MIRGDYVTVVRKVVAGMDEYNAEVTEEETEVVLNVLYHQSDTSENVEGARPDGDSRTLTLHFPKGYERPLRGCDVIVRGERYRVVGDPRPYMDSNCPGPWHMPVKAVSVDG